MAHRHLTDDEIQSFLDGNLSQADIVGHLQTCEYCQYQLKQYQQLYIELAHDKGFNLSTDFARRVISRLQTEPSRSLMQRLWDVSIWVVGLLAGVVTSFYFIDLKLVSKEISEALSSLGTLNSAMLSVFKTFDKSLNLNIPQLAIAGFVLMLILAIDHFILHRIRNLRSSFS